MDRLRTGRRRVRAGSVHVTELINKQALRTGVPAPPAEAVEVIEPVAPAQRSSKGAQLAKLTSLGAATLVLCGSVAVASMISHDRADRRAAERPAIGITGDQALLPDRLDRTIPGGDTQAPPPPSPRPAERPAPAAPAAPEPEHRETAPSSPAATTHPDPPAARPVSATELVRDFYRLLPRDPNAAFDLISPNPLSTTLAEFHESWSKVSGVDVVDVRERADGVLAVVRMTLTDGGHLRVEQLLTVADSPRRIVGAQLLSAQRN